MKKVEFLGRAFGEYKDTDYTPIKVYVGQEYDKEAQKGCILNSDDWRPCSKPLFSIMTIEIPEWMLPEEYLSLAHKWKWYQKIGGTESLGKEVFLALSSLECGALRLACVKLLKTKTFRSKYRESLCNQLKKWITEQGYVRPFTYKKTESLLDVYTIKEAKRIGVIA